MLQKLIQANRWYDQQKEPKRFLLAASVFSPAIVLNGQSVPASIIAIAWLVVFGTMRFYYLRIGHGGK